MFAHFFFQCKVAAAMMAASTSASYSSVNQYDGTTILPANRSILGRRHLNSCSSCDTCSNSICPETVAASASADSNSCQSGHHHFHHTRRPAMRQNKRCTFATGVASMSVANKNGGPPTTTIVSPQYGHTAASIRLVPKPSLSHSYFRGGSAGPGAVTATSHHRLQSSEYRLPRTKIESSSTSAISLSPVVVVVSTNSPLYPLPNTIVQSSSCVSVSSSTSSDMSSVSASIQVND